MHRSNARRARGYVAGSMVLAIVVAALATSASAQAAVIKRTLATMYVPGTANIYSAGSYTGYTLPTAIGLPEPFNPDRVVTFPVVSGQVNCVHGPTEPDGGNCGGFGLSPSYPAALVPPPGTRDPSFDGVGIRGYRDADPGRYMALAGVFLNDEDAPPPLSAIPQERRNFTTKADSSVTSDEHDFPRLSPELKQVFFIGDGRRTKYPIREGGDDDDSVQQFQVPRGAARLYLGFQDYNGNTDNSGRFKVKINWRIANPTATGAIAKISAEAKRKKAKKSRRHTGKNRTARRRAAGT